MMVEIPGGKASGTPSPLASRGRRQTHCWRGCGKGGCAWVGPRRPTHPAPPLPPPRSLGPRLRSPFTCTTLLAAPDVAGALLGCGAGCRGENASFGVWSGTRRCKGESFKRDEPPLSNCNSLGGAARKSPLLCQGCKSECGVRGRQIKLRAPELGGPRLTHPWVNLQRCGLSRSKIRGTLRCPPRGVPGIAREGPTMK